MRTTYEEIALQALLFIISIFSPHRPTKLHFCGAPTGLTCSQSRFSLTQIFYFSIKNIIHFYSFYLHPTSKKFALKKGDRCYTVSTKGVKIFVFLLFYLFNNLKINFSVKRNGVYHFDPYLFAYAVIISPPL